MSIPIQIRQFTERDIPAVRSLYYDVYGQSYPYKAFYDDEWLKRSIYQDSYLSLVAEVEGRIAGTASVYFEVGAFADLCGEFGRLAVHPDFRNLGVGTELMRARIEFANRRLHFGLAECRTAHTGAQTISHQFGFMPIGFLPLKAKLSVRESLVLTGRLFGNQPGELRRNNPRVIPEIFLLGQLALENLGLRNDLIAVDDADDYPMGTGFEVSELKEDEFPSLLRIERGRLSRRNVFGNLQLTAGLFMLQLHDSRYLVAREDNKIVGSIGFVVDDVGHTLKVLEMIVLRDDVAGFLLKELDRRALDSYGTEYLEITVSAYSPTIQRTLSNLGFVPVAYCPSFVFHEVERLDTVKMAKVYVPLDIDRAQLTEESQQVFKLVREGFEEKQMGIVVNQATRQMASFQGLEEGELSKIAALCRVITFAPGETILRAGEQGKVMYMVMEGDIDIFAADNHQLIGQVQQGDVIGEISMVMQQPYGATAVACTDVKLAALKHQDFDHLIDRHPRIGMKIMRNIAISLGQKLSDQYRRFAFR